MSKRTMITEVTTLRNCYCAVYWDIQQTFGNSVWEKQRRLRMTRTLNQLKQLLLDSGLTEFELSNLRDQ